MDGSRFDDLTRSLAGGTSRRGFVAGLAALAAGLAARPSVDAACPSGQVAARGACVCKTTGRPPNAAGLCPCPSGQTRCADACVDLGRDVAHCGACGAACAVGTGVAEVVCRQGSCKVKSCTPGLANCDGDLVCETALGTDSDCGSCGDACTGAGVTCGGGGVDGQCGASCAANGAGCTGNGDCCSGICQGGACVATVAGTCPPGGNVCTGEFFANICADHACYCYQTPGAAPATVCAARLDYVCQECATDADCQDGSFCVAAPGGSLALCGCGEGTACVRPCAPDAQGCFVSGTRIAMADGTSRPVEDVAPGDYVLGRAGRANRVVAVDRPRLGNRLLYALNGGAHFVTAGHPFLADGAWKTIDPAATAAENPTLLVGRLAVGDRLLALTGVLVPAAVGGWNGAESVEPVELRAEPVLLERIEARPADPATPLYNLRLDGDHTYFADDLLVHNK